MAIPTVAEVYTLARALLGDPAGKVYNDSTCGLGFGMAYRRLKEEMLNAQVPRVLKIATHTLAANTTSLTPAAASISSLGELSVPLEERAAGSSEDFVPMAELGTLPQRAKGTALLEYVWREDTFQFVGATTSRELRISYFESDGAVPAADASVGIDGTLNLLATLTAAYMGPMKGDDERAAALEVKALGRNLDGRGGYMNSFLVPLVRSMQRTHAVQPAAYSTARRTAFVRAPYRPIRLS